MAFSLISLSTILILLVHFDGKPWFEWHRVTLNAVVSVFATMSRVLLFVPISSGIGQLRWNWFSSRSRALDDFEVFDAARRGAWGSAKLLWKTKSW